MGSRQNSRGKAPRGARKGAVAAKKTTTKTSAAAKKNPGRGTKPAPKERTAATKPSAKRSTKQNAKQGAKRPGKAAPKRSTKRPAFNPKTDSANDPRWVPPVWNDDVLLGAHVSIAGGTHQAPPRARAIGATAMQMFTKMANRWADRVCEDDECSVFRTALAETRVGATMAHDSYLINLASPDAVLRRRSIESFVTELARCEALAIGFLVSHPGNYIDNVASGIARNADAITEALSRVPGRTVLCLESTAGTGTALGAASLSRRHLRRHMPRVFRGI
jgi:deoxyribonuclease IV